jgi:hypothetical protein
MRARALANPGRRGDVIGAFAAASTRSIQAETCEQISLIEVISSGQAAR